MSTKSTDTKQQDRVWFIRGKTEHQPQPQTQSDGLSLSLDGTYPPALQPDYGGNIFDHSDDYMLKQLPVYNNEGHLVEPWNLWKHLRIGTLVTLNAELHCWVYKSDKRRKVCNAASASKTSNTVQIFQLQVTFIKICDESPEPIMVPKIQLYPDIDNDEAESPSRNIGKGKGRAANDDNLLATMEMSPSKKSRKF